MAGVPTVLVRFRRGPFATGFSVAIVCFASVAALLARAALALACSFACAHECIAGVATAMRLAVARSFLRALGPSPPAQVHHHEAHHR